MDKQINFFQKNKLWFVIIIVLIFLCTCFFALNRWMQISEGQIDEISLMAGEQVQSLSLSEAVAAATDYMAGQVVSVTPVQENGDELYEVRIKSNEGIFNIYVSQRNGTITRLNMVEDIAQAEPTPDTASDPQPSTEKPSTNAGTQSNADGDTNSNSNSNTNTSNQNTSQGNGGESATTPKKNLTLNEAKALALKEVNGTIVKSERDYDDGVLYYEFKISTGKKLYEVEIHAQSGLVTKVQLEDDDDYDNDYYDDYDDDDYDD